MNEFEYRNIYITEKKYISSLADLLSHPNVTYVLEGICDFVMYEFYDEIYKYLFSYDTVVQSQAYADPKITQRSKELRVEKEKLLTPLYEYPDSLNEDGTKSQCIDFMVRIVNIQKSCRKNYELMKPCRKRIDGISVKHLHFPNNIEVRIKLTRKIGKKTKNLYNNLLLEWQNWIKQHHATIILNKAIFQEKEVTLSLNLGEIYDDYLAMLLIICRHFRKELAIRSFSIGWED